MSVKIYPIIANPDLDFQLEIDNFPLDGYFNRVVEVNGCLYAEVESDKDYDSVDNYMDECVDKDLLDLFK